PSVEIPCVKAKFVFVTSESMAGVDLGGVAGARARCNALAQAAGLPGTYDVWLSDSQTSPAARRADNSDPYDWSGPWQLVNGARVADDWDDLSDAGLQQRIIRTETGAQVSTFVWTGTKTDGSAADAHCNDWTAQNELGQAGRTTFSNYTWTSGFTEGCGTSSLPTYCFEQ
ncbi:MAG: hypothetical protein ACPHCJ_08315, partial [Oceanococcaceae bacterium]